MYTYLIKLYMKSYLRQTEIDMVVLGRIKIAVTKEARDKSMINNREQDQDAL